MAGPNLRDKKVVFICGLHRSGTSILHKVLKKQEFISGFENTNVPEDEGQHLQTAFEPAKTYGGAGKFGFHQDARLDENSPLITETNKQNLINEWSKYWDLEKSILVEKSPPNLIRTRFLQAMLPNTYFITILRHPIAVAYATQQYKSILQQGTDSSINRLLDHWRICYQMFLNDRRHLNNHITFTYEELVHAPHNILDLLSEFLGAKIVYKGEFKNKNYKYFKKWEAHHFSLLKPIKRRKFISKYEQTMNCFGYSLIELDKYSNFKDLEKI